MKFFNIKDQKIPQVILVGFLCLWLFLGGIAAGWVCVPVILPDEFGYWAQAANMAGMDWKEIVSHHSWYSFGYGILMLPFVKLLSNPIAAYRVVTGINFLLMGGSTLLLYQILSKLCVMPDKKKTAVVSGAAMIYVSYLTYAHTTMAESLLTFLYVLLAYGLYLWFAEKKAGSLILVLLTAGYMYTVHMRSIGILLAAALVWLAFVWSSREKKAGARVLVTMLLVIGFITILLVQNMGKTRLINSVNAEGFHMLTRGNDYAGQWNKLKFLFSLKGIGYFFTGLFGKIFYLGCASFGLYYWGMAYLIKKGKELFSSLKKGEVCRWENWFCLWLLLSHVAALLVSTLYCIRTNRLDGILYGRYHENTLPFITAFGIAALLSKPKPKERILWLIGLAGAGFFFVYTMLRSGQIGYTNRHSITGILYALSLAGFYDGTTVLYAYLGCLLGGMLLLALRMVKKHGAGLLLTGIICIQLANAAYAVRFLIYPSVQNQREDMEGIWQAKQLADEKGVTAFYYLCGGADKSIYTLQYALWDTPLHLMEKEKLADMTAGSVLEDAGEVFLIVPTGDESAENISPYYTEVIRTPHYEIYFTQ